MPTRALPSSSLLTSLPLIWALCILLEMLAYSDDSDAEYDDPHIVLDRYRKGRFRHALCSPDSYYRACQELAELYRGVSDCSVARVKKAILSDLVSDTRLAIEECDG